MKISRLTLMVIFLFWGSFAQAEGLKNKEFLQFSESQQHWWYAGAIEALGHMVFLHDEQKAQCVWRWLPTDPEKKKKLLQVSMEKYPEHAPTAILIALIQRKCGKLMPETT